MNSIEVKTKSGKVITFVVRTPEEIEQSRIKAYKLLVP